MVSKEYSRKVSVQTDTVLNLADQFRRNRDVVLRYLAPLGVVLRFIESRLMGGADRQWKTVEDAEQLARQDQRQDVKARGKGRHTRTLGGTAGASGPDRHSARMR